MQIIPVLDLRDGLVVRAHQGQRAQYQPLASSLCRSSSPTDVLAALLDLFPFPTVYLADLNAIQRNGSSSETVLALTRGYTQVQFWLDGGFRAADEFERWRDSLNVHIVIGTESHESADGLFSLVAALSSQRWVLSLDYFRNELLGPREILGQTERWPERVIVMCMDQIGGDDGPDLTRLTAVHASREHQLFAAGGVRSVEDLRRLRQCGAQGVLLASALHDGRINRADLDAWAREGAV
jgi:phosphoribosylformimino-5-aminoimidazole carboxamide ribotide isomerase